VLAARHCHSIAHALVQPWLQARRVLKQLAAHQLRKARDQRIGGDPAIALCTRIE